MKQLSAFLLSVGLLAAPAAAEIYEYEPGAFDKIMVRADIDVVYRNVPDSAGFIRYESNRDYSEKIEVTCNKGKLSIVDKLTDEDYGKLPTLYMYSDYLLSVSYEGAGTVDVNMSTATPTFSAKLIGNGTIIVNGVNTTDFSANIVTGNGTIAASGKCRKAKFTLTGTGVIQADRLYADEVNCKALGTGTIGCHPIDKLNVMGIGSTKVYYYGDPTVKKMGGAKLEHMQSADDDEITERENPEERKPGVTLVPISKGEEEEETEGVEETE